MNNTRLQVMPTMALTPRAVPSGHEEDFVAVERYDTQQLMNDWILPVGETPREVEVKALKKTMPIPYVLDDDNDDEFVKLEEVVHDEIDYELKAAVDMLLVEDGQGKKRKAKRHVVLVDTDEEDELFDPPAVAVAPAKETVKMGREVKKGEQQ
jgi:hypothetical protein